MDEFRFTPEDFAGQTWTNFKEMHMINEADAHNLAEICNGKLAEHISKLPKVQSCFDPQSVHMWTSEKEFHGSGMVYEARLFNVRKITGGVDASVPER